MTTQTGPCAKVRVFCTLVHPDGRRWTGENVVRKPQEVCPRGDLPSGVGYEMCRDVCDQVGHAEVVALEAAGERARGCTAYIEGRDYICTNCQTALLNAGVRNWVIGEPPHSHAQMLGRIHNLEQKLEYVISRNEYLESLRPHWAQGYSSDSQAAQAATGALQGLWKLLDVKNQTDAMGKLSRLVTGEKK